jgi:hypothetical protein
MSQELLSSRALVPSVVPTLGHGRDCIKRARLEQHAQNRCRALKSNSVQIGGTGHASSQTKKAKGTPGPLPL